MEDKYKKKAQLISELSALRQQVVRLKAAQEKTDMVLREVETKWSLLFENPFFGVSIYEEEAITGVRKLLDCNDRYVEMTGRSREELFSSSNTTLFHKKLLSAQTVTEQKELRRNLVPYGDHFSWRRPDNKENVIEYIAYPVEIGGKPLTIGIDRDITGLKQAESVLQQSEELFRAMFEQAAVGVSQTVAKTGEFVRVNQKYCDILGYTPEEMSQLTFQEISHPDDLQENLAKVQQLLDGKIDSFTLEKRYYHKNGSIVWVRLSNAPLKEVGKRTQYHIAFIEDITERVQAEESLHESEERYRQLVENAGDIIYKVDVYAQVSFVNHNGAKILGYTERELVGRCYLDFVHPDYRKKVSRFYRVQFLRRKTSTYYELPVITRDGTEFWVGQSVQLVFEGSEIVGFQAVARDITKRIRAEEALQDSNQHLEAALSQLKATQEQILQQERLAAVGQLAAGIAHDFNNILTGILGFSELLLLQKEISEGAQRQVKHIVKQSKRAAALVRQILDFSRISVPHSQYLDLSPFLEEAVSFLKRTIPEKIHINLKVGPGEHLVNADPAQIQQVLTNLAVNARDAMPQGGDLLFHLFDFELKPGDKPPYKLMKPGTWVALSVSDTGVGIPTGVLHRVFEPFFTTKDVGKGTGLGLAQVYGIVKQHNGYIDVISQEGQGTTFTFYLPALPGEMSFTAEIPANIVTGNGETILLVEDEPTVLAVGEKMLEYLGYQVLTATDGKEALIIYEKYKDQIALVLLDMVMPGMDGLEVLGAMRVQNPEVKVLIITGYSSREVAQTMLAQGAVNWLHKPLEVTSLAQAVNQALEKQT